MNIDEQLKQLAIEAQRHAPNTKERQQILAQLISELWQSGKLVRPYAGQFRGFYQDIYAEALQRLFLHVCEAIDEYNRDLEVLQWVNFLLRKRFFVEASRDVMPTAPKGMNQRLLKKVTIDVLEKQNPVAMGVDSGVSLSQEVVLCIQEDRDGLFRSTYVSKNPAANFQFIALRFLGGYSWKEISEELKVKVPTLSSFYQRCVTKFAPKFKEYLTQ